MLQNQYSSDTEEQTNSVNIVDNQSSINEESSVAVEVVQNAFSTESPTTTELHTTIPDTDAPGTSEVTTLQQEVLRLRECLQISQEKNDSM